MKIKANDKGAALLQRMLDDKIRVREALRKDPNLTEVDGIKLIKAVPAPTAAK